MAECWPIYCRIKSFNKVQLNLEKSSINMLFRLQFQRMIFKVMPLAFHLSHCQLVTHGKSYLLGLNKTQEASPKSQVPSPIIPTACSGQGAWNRTNANNRAVKRERNNLNRKTQTAVAVLSQRWKCATPIPQEEDINIYREPLRQ